jgi:hypothetical protein
MSGGECPVVNGQWNGLVVRVVSVTPAAVRGAPLTGRRPPSAGSTGRERDGRPTIQSRVGEPFGRLVRLSLSRQPVTRRSWRARRH